MAGMKIQPINVDKNGAIDMRHLRAMVSHVHVHFFPPEFECDLIVAFFPAFSYYENHEIEHERYAYYNFEILNSLLKIMFQKFSNIMNASHFVEYKIAKFWSYLLHASARKKNLHARFVMRFNLGI